MGKGAVIIAKGKFERWRTEEGLTLLRGWAREGATDAAIAKALHINVATLYDWKKRFPDIDNALKQGKEVVDFRVEESGLLRRALGYDVTETRTEREEGGATRTVTTVRHVPPDTAAAIFWLKNRRPDRWRDKPIPDDTAATREANAQTQAIASLVNDPVPERRREDFEVDVPEIPDQPERGGGVP